MAINPLVTILERATDRGILTKLRGRRARLQTSLYADDAVIFLSPTANDVAALKEILHHFGQVTGLVTNLIKSLVAPIRCSNIDVRAVLADFPAAIVGFPFKYLGLPLTLSRLKKVDCQSLLDKAAGRLAHWQGRLLNLAGRNTLVKSVLSSQPIYFLTALNPPKDILKKLDCKRRRFLWVGAHQISGGKCKVNWKRCNRPTKLGGLSILDLYRFARALRLRWLWHGWRSENKPWVGMDVPCDETDRQLFNAATKVTLGNGAKALFWHSAWLDGASPKDIAPDIFLASKKKNKTVHHALQGNSWVQDINIPAINAHQKLTQFVALWDRLQHIYVNVNTSDHIEWMLNTSGDYSTKSAYMGHGSISWIDKH